MMIEHTGRADVDGHITRAHRFLGLTRSPNTREARYAARHAEQLLRRERLAVGELAAYPPSWTRSVCVAYDKITVLVDGKPWWRAHLALVIASFCGFHNDSPWEAPPGQTPVIQLLGTREAVERARWLYAGVSLAMVGLRKRLGGNELDALEELGDIASWLSPWSRGPRTPPPPPPVPFEGNLALRDAYLWGVTMAEAKYFLELKTLLKARAGESPGELAGGDDFAAIVHGTAQYRFNRRHRTAMVLWRPEPEPELYEAPTSPEEPRRRPTRPTEASAEDGAATDPAAPRESAPGQVVTDSATLAMFKTYAREPTTTDAYAEGHVAGGQVAAGLLLKPRRTIPT